MGLSTTWMGSLFTVALLLARVLLLPSSYAANQGSMNPSQIPDVDHSKRLRVTLRSSQFQDSMSARHSFGQLELHNIHTHESAVIHSISTTTEETSWVDAKTGKRHYWSAATRDSETFEIGSDGRVSKLIGEMDRDYRAQVYLGRLPGSSLHLGPNQVAVLPLCLLPRFPPEHELSDQSTPLRPHPTTEFGTEYVQVEWDDWVSAGSLRRSNVDADTSRWPVGQYTMKTSLVIESNRGTIRIPVSGLSSFKNDYGLPGVISLETSKDQSRSLHKSSPENESLTVVSQIQTVAINGECGKPEKRTNATDCYDLYMKHPYHARSQLRAEYDDETDVDPPIDNLRVTEVAVSKPSVAFVQWIPELHGVRGKRKPPRQLIKDWNGRGPLQIPADNKMHYLATVCAASHAVQVESKVNRDSQDDLTGWHLDSLSKLPDSLGFLQIRTSQDNLAIALEKKRITEKRDTSTDFFESFQTERHTEETQSMSLPLGVSALPSSLQHLVYLSGNTGAECLSESFSFDLATEIDAEVRVIRAAIVANSSVDGISLNLTGLDSQLGSTLAPDSYVSDAIMMECIIDQEALMKNSASNNIAFEAAIVIRAVRVGMEIRGHQQEQMSFAIEIPVRIRVSKGEIDVHANENSEFVGFDNTAPALPTGFKELTGIYFPTDPTRRFHAKIVRQDVVVTTSMDAALRIDEVEIREQSNELRSNSQCSALSAETSEIRLAISNDLAHLGIITVRHELLDLRDARRDAGPVWCMLRFTTLPSTGDHQIPIAIYTGEVEISENPFMSKMVRKGGLKTGNVLSPGRWNQAIVSFPEFLDWFDTSRAGRALYKTLLGPEGRKSSTEKNKSNEDILKKYLLSLTVSSVARRSFHLKPVLLRVGAIAQGDVETVPLYLTNHNPVTLRVSIDVNKVEGFSIRLGRDASSRSGDGNSVLDYLPPADRVKVDSPISVDDCICSKKHPVKGLRQLLLRNTAVTDYMNRFSYRDAVSMSALAVENAPELKTLFRQNVYGRFYMEAVSEEPGCGANGHLDEYGPFSRRISKTDVAVGPLIVSHDGKKVRKLRACRNNGDALEKSSFDLPPGGVARFDITLRSPPASVLERDITEFLTTGLVLSTNHGDVIPVFVSFEALQGKLQLAHVPPPQLRTDFRDGVIQVPVGLFDEYSRDNAQHNLSAVHVPPDTDSGLLMAKGVGVISRNATAAQDVPLFMKSTFSRDIKIRRILSCNPWFRVDLPAASDGLGSYDDPYLGVKIGAVTSAVVCDGDSDGTTGMNTSFPSFFRCAISWLSRRAELQPRGCGLLPLSSDRRSYSTDEVENRSMQRMTDLLRGAAMTIEQNNFDSRQPTESSKKKARTGDGKVTLSVLKAAAEAWEAWAAISEFGLRTMGTSLRAVVEYNSTPDELPLDEDSSEAEDHVITVAIRNVTVESVLDVPLLLDTSNADASSLFLSSDSSYPNEWYALPTIVGDVSSTMIPLHNPTAVPVKVRLAVAAPSKDRFLQTPSSELSNPTVSKYCGTFPPPYVQSASYSTPGTTDDVNRQWWGPEGAYFQTNDYGETIRSHQNVTIKATSGAKLTLINPSVMFNNALLVGCGSRCGLKEDSGHKRTPFVHGLDLSPTSPLGASAAAGSLLFGRGTALAAANKARLNEGFEAGGSMMLAGSGPSAFAIPFFALREITLPPFGKAEIGPILFRPPGHSSKLGCAALSGSRSGGPCESNTFESLVFLENSLSGLERVVMKGRALWARLVFLDSNESDEFGSIELRNGMSTLVFSGHATATLDEPAGSSTKTVWTYNSGDVVINITSIKLHDGSIPATDNSCAAGEFALVDCFQIPYTLQPGENESFAIRHFPSCAKKRNFVKLTVEFGAWHQQVAKYSTVDLAIGYEMNDQEFHTCGHRLFSPDMLRTNILKILLRLLRWVWRIIWSIVRVLCVVLLVWSLGGRSMNRQVFTDRFTMFLDRGHNDKLVEISPVYEMGRTWYSAFRCLARVEPSSIDLHSLGREQTRQIVLHRYRMMAAVPPQYFTGVGILNRERLPGFAATSRTSNGMRTLSDALFGELSALGGDNGIPQPCRLGWKPAVARGMIDKNTLLSSPLALETEHLMESRRLELDSKFDSEGPPSPGSSGDGATFEITESSSVERESPVADKDEDNRPIVRSSHNIVPVENDDKKGWHKVSVESKETGMFERQSKKDRREKGVHAIKQTDVADTKPDSRPTLPRKHKVSDAAPSEAMGHKPGTTRDDNKQSKDQKLRTSMREAVPAKSRKETQKSKVDRTKRADKKKMSPQGKMLGSGSNAWGSSAAPKIKATVLPKEPKFRPPPGLAPPPGFDATSATTGAFQKIKTSSESVSPNVIPSPAPGHADRSNASRTSSFASTEGFLLGQPQPSSRFVSGETNDSKLAFEESVFAASNLGAKPGEDKPMAPRNDNASVLSGNAEFDVMAFLDGILDENNKVGDETKIEGNNLMESNLVGSQAFSPNPWATSDIYHSRAAAYGFVIEEESHRDPEPVDLPVLTPEAILSSEAVGEDTIGPEESMSFYSDLIG